jgi:hypothetical protein
MTRGKASVNHMAKNSVTLTIDPDTLASAREHAGREGLSLSVWIDRAAREKALREDFEQHAEVMRVSGLYGDLDLAGHAADLDAAERELAA